METNTTVKFLKNIGVNPKEIKLCIETGTYKGWGTKRWAEFFDEVITIELSKDLFEYCKKTYNFENVKFLQGSSNKILSKIVDEINCSYFLFLDAHGSGGDTTFDDDIGRFGSPVIKEIQAVKKNPPKIIAVDDLSDFSDIKSYPSPEQIKKEVAKIGSYTSSVYKQDDFTKGILVFNLSE